MLSVKVENSGKNTSLSITTTPTPEPRSNEILVKHRATAINRADLLQRRGGYDPPEGESSIMGLEMAGIVTATGSAVSKWSEGDEVFGLLPGGGYAEYSTLHENMAMPIPGGLTFKETAAVPETFITAYQALFLLAELQPGETVLIHAGASGVGTAAIQLARSVVSEIFVTCGKPHKAEACKKLGADYAINYTKEDFAEQIAQITNDQGIDVILDFIGANYWQQNLSSLALDGRLILLGLLGGHITDGFSLLPVLKKRISLIASTLRSRSLEYKINLTQKFKDDFLGKLAAGEISPVIDSVLHWHDVEQAHERMAQNKNTGKIVLTFDE